MEGADIIMGESWCSEVSKECNSTEYRLVNKFTLKSVFSNRQDCPLVIYRSNKFEGSHAGICKYPFGTVIAKNLSDKHPLTLLIKKDEHCYEQLYVPPKSEAALSVTSIEEASVYADSGGIAAGLFYFDLIQPIDL